MKTFNEFLEEETQLEDYRKILKRKPKLKTVVYSYPIGVGSVYYGFGGGNNDSGGGETSGGGGE